jgi:small subunit ribosomal protein S6
MAFYETVFIARQDLSSAQTEALTEDFSKLIVELGGKVTKTEQWGLRSLTYRINKNRKGHYVLMNIDGPHAAVAELERRMRLNEDVLRYLTIRMDELENEPSAMMRSRGERDRGERGDRPDRGDRGPRGPRFGGERSDRGDRGDRSFSGRPSYGGGEAADEAELG